MHPGWPPDSWPPACRGACVGGNNLLCTSAITCCAGRVLTMRVHSRCNSAPCISHTHTAVYKKQTPTIATLYGWKVFIACMAPGARTPQSTHKHSANEAMPGTRHPSSCRRRSTIVSRAPASTSALDHLFELNGTLAAKPSSQSLDTTGVASPVMMPWSFAQHRRRSVSGFAGPRLQNRRALHRTAG